MTEINNMFDGQIDMSITDTISANSAIGGDALDMKEYVDRFTIVDVEQQKLLTSSPIQFSTSYDLITVHNPDAIGENQSNARSLQDALIGHFNSANSLDGYYNVDWNSTSIWHEMTLFQNRTSSRFFAIWGYFHKDALPRKNISNESTIIVDGKSIAVFKDNNFIDPVDSTTWGDGVSSYEAAIVESKADKRLCGSFLNPADIYIYYRIPKYEISETTPSSMKAVWQRTGWLRPNIPQLENLWRRVYQSSITDTIYEASHLQEALPLEEYDTSGPTTAVVSSEEIIQLFTSSANSGCENWANSTSIGGGSHTNGPITTIRGRR